MLTLFRQNNPYVLVFIPISVIVLLSLNTLFPYHLPDLEVSFGLWGKIQGEKLFFSSIFSGTVIALSAIIINNIFNRNEFSDKNNFLPAILYILYLSFFHSFYYTDGLAITQFFLILMIRQLFRLRQKDDGRKLMFNAGFLFGVACTFSPLLIFGLPFIFLIVWISRPFIFRESALLITGVILPFIYVLVYLTFFQINFDLENLNASSKEVFVIDMWLVIGSLFLFFFMGIGDLLNTMNSSSIRLKKVFRMLLLLAIFTFGLLLFDVLAYKKIQIFSFCFVPVAFVLPYSFGKSKQNKGAALIFYILILFTITKFFVPYEDLIF
tara:strand:+ start:2889 stop:3860 length:972 start_codon:yes stop_codon:yes gene_type:complete